MSEEQMPYAIDLGKLTTAALKMCGVENENRRLSEDNAGLRLRIAQLETVNAELTAEVSRCQKENAFLNQTFDRLNDKAFELIQIISEANDI